MRKLQQDEFRVHAKRIVHGEHPRKRSGNDKSEPRIPQPTTLGSVEQTTESFLLNCLSC